jgi:cell division protein FtsL
MKSLFERIKNLGFKKAFITFFAAFHIFVAVYVLYMAANGLWNML